LGRKSSAAVAVLAVDAMTAGGCALNGSAVEFRAEGRRIIDAGDPVGTLRAGLAEHTVAPDTVAADAVRSAASEYSVAVLRASGQAIACDADAGDTVAAIGRAQYSIAATRRDAPGARNSPRAVAETRHSLNPFAHRFRDSRPVFLRLCPCG
jgi:hypothetical protein